MRLSIAAVALFLGLVAIASVSADKPAPDTGKQKGVLLLGSLEEFMYPGAKMPDGATMSGNGPYPAMQFVICRTVLTTPDPLEKVADFYSKKFEIADKADKAEGRSKAGDAQAVTMLDDSKGRPVGLRVFTVNRPKMTTTLVVSRAEGEKETHIAWSHFVRIGDER